MFKVKTSRKLFLQIILRESLIKEDCHYYVFENLLSMGDNQIRFRNKNLKYLWRVTVAEDKHSLHEYFGGR